MCNLAAISKTVSIYYVQQYYSIRILHLLHIHVLALIGIIQYVNQPAHEIWVLIILSSNDDSGEPAQMH